MLGKDADLLTRYICGPIFSTIATDNNVRDLLSSKNFTKTLSELKVTLSYSKSSEAKKKVLLDFMQRGDGGSLHRLYDALLAREGRNPLGPSNVKKDAKGDGFIFEAPPAWKTESMEGFHYDPEDFSDFGNQKGFLNPQTDPVVVKNNNNNNNNNNNGGKVKDMENVGKARNLVKSGKVKALERFLVKVGSVICWLGDDLDYNLLHYAAKCNRGDMVRHLVLKQGMDVNIKSRYGKTALHLAAIEGKLRAIQSLLACGAKMDILDDKGFGPLDYALSSGNAEAVNELLSYVPEERDSKKEKEEKKRDALKKSLDRMEGTELEEEEKKDAQNEEEKPLQEEQEQEKEEKKEDAEYSLLLKKFEELRAELDESRGEVRDLRRMNHELEDVLHCCVCLEKYRDSVLLPCYHNVLCHVCAGQVRKKTGVCPICSRQIKQIKRLYQ